MRRQLCPRLLACRRPAARCASVPLPLITFLSSHYLPSPPHRQTDLATAGDIAAKDRRRFDKLEASLNEAEARLRGVTRERDELAANAQVCREGGKEVLPRPLKEDTE